jgi:transposase
LAGCSDCTKQAKQIKDLQGQIAILRFELEDYKSKRFKAKKKKPPKQDSPQPTPKKKGGLFGHTGWFRSKPGKINKIEEVRLWRCPLCGSKDMTECVETEDHVQEDIVLPEAEVRVFRKHKYYCRKCKKTVTGLGKNELPNSKIGPIAKAWAVFLKHGIKISDRDVTNILKAFGLKIVPSSIVGFRNQLKRGALPVYKQLIAALKHGRFIHADETGWRIDGDNSWLWKFSNKKISVTYPDKSRGQKVVKDVLGDNYDGVLVSDFLSAYNKIDSRKQRCLVHILRDLDKVINYWQEEDTQTIKYCERLKAILMQAIELHREYKNKSWDNIYRKQRKSIVCQLNDFSFPDPNKKMLVRFAKRLIRHKDEMFTFLYERDVDYHNNHAEQQIRPNVLLRKITFGNRSEKGAKVHDVVMSVLQTAKLNKKDPIETIKDLLLPAGKNPFAEILASPP